MEGRGWTYAVLECYCMQGTSCKTDKVMHEVTNIDIEAGKIETKEVPNKCYDPDFVEEPAPEGCPEVPRTKCLELKCPHFAWADVSEEHMELIELGAKLYQRGYNACDEEHEAVKRILEKKKKQ